MPVLAESHPPSRGLFCYTRRVVLVGFGRVFWFFFFICGSFAPYCSFSSFALARPFFALLVFGLLLAFLLVMSVGFLFLFATLSGPWFCLGSVVFLCFASDVDWAGYCLCTRYNWGLWAVQCIPSFVGCFFAWLCTFFVLMCRRPAGIGLLFADFLTFAAVWFGFFCLFAVGVRCLRPSLRGLCASFSFVSLVSCSVDVDR